MSERFDFRNRSKDRESPIHTSAGMSDPADTTGRASDGADLAATDMSAEPSSRTEETQPEFGEGRRTDEGGRTEEEGELHELKERHLRLAAEFDNYRKRTARERADLGDRAQAGFVSRIIDVLDDLDRLVASDASTPLATLREGLSAVDRKLWKQLQDAGVERLAPTGQAFDPAEHEAVSIIPPPGPDKDHTVSATFQPGYKFKGVMVRPARVQVYSGEGQA